MSNDGGRRVPANELDFNFMMSDPDWGKKTTEELYEKLGTNVPYVVAIDLNGHVTYDEDGNPQVFTLNNEGNLVNKKGALITDADGNPIQIFIKQSLWGLLAYYTRDIRLGNLSTNDYIYCMHYLNLAGDALREGYTKSFMSGLTRVISALELSQSKSGFLRKNLNTIRQEVAQGNIEPPKKSLFKGKNYGGKKYE